LDDDDHFDDVVTEGTETDNEVINNLQSFKYRDTAQVNDSDVDSDAGSTSHRFGLTPMLQSNYQQNNNSDSENEETYQYRKKNKPEDIDDMGMIDDISEHSSDDIDSESGDEAVTPLQKQIKKQNKRKKRKMEAMKKAQQAAEKKKSEPSKAEVVKKTIELKKNKNSQEPPKAKDTKKDTEKKK
jgi:hypothetical protein